MRRVVFEEALGQKRSFVLYGDDGKATTDLCGKVKVPSVLEAFEATFVLWDSGDGILCTLESAPDGLSLDSFTSGATCKVEVKRDDAPTAKRQKSDAEWVSIMLAQMKNFLTSMTSVNSQHCVGETIMKSSMWCTTLSEKELENYLGVPVMNADLLIEKVLTELNKPVGHTLAAWDTLAERGLNMYNAHAEKKGWKSLKADDLKNRNGECKELFVQLAISYLLVLVKELCPGVEWFAIDTSVSGIPGHDNDPRSKRQKLDDGTSKTVHVIALLKKLVTGQRILEKGLLASLWLTFWGDIASTVTSETTVQFRKSLVDYYGDETDKNNVKHEKLPLRCMVTDLRLLGTWITAAHLLGRKHSAKAHVFGFYEIDDPRNGLLWNRAFEEAYSCYRIVFSWDRYANSFCIHVLDKALVG